MPIDKKAQPNSNKSDPRLRAALANLSPGVTNPGGSPGQLQFNYGGVFGGTDFLSYSQLTKVLTVGSATNTVPAMLLDPSVTQFGIFGSATTAISTANQGNTCITGSVRVSGPNGISTGALLQTTGGNSYAGSESGGGFQLYSGNAISWDGTGSAVGGLINFAAGYGLNAQGTGQSGHIQFIAGATLINAALTFHISNGGSGYTDGTYCDRTQVGGDLAAYNATTGAGISLQSVTIVGGSIVSAVVLYPYGSSVVGDVMDLSLGGSSYRGAGSGAQLTVDSVASGLGGQIKFGAADGSWSLRIDTFGEWLDHTGSSGTVGQVLTSSGTGAPPAWANSSAPVPSYDAITDGGSLTIADGTNLEYLRATADCAAFTVTMPADPTDGQVVRIACNFNLNSFALSANTGQTLENPPSRLPAGLTVAFVYNLLLTTWIRTS